MAIPPRPPNDFNVTDMTLMDAHIAMYFPTASPVDDALKSAQEGEADLIEAQINDSDRNIPQFYRSSNTTFADFAHQEIKNIFGGGSEPDLSWSDKNDDDIILFKDDQPSEMDIVIPTNKAQEELIDEEIEEWEMENLPKGTLSRSNSTVISKNTSTATSSQDEIGPNKIIKNEVDDEKSQIKLSKVSNTNATKGDNNESTEEQNQYMQQNEEPVNVNKIAIDNPVSEIPPTPATLSAVPPTPLITSTPTNSPISIVASTVTPTMTPEDFPPCHSFDAHTISHFSCNTSVPTVLVYSTVSFVPLLLILCCWKYYYGGKSKGNDVRGDYRAVSATYGDASFDNAFSDNFSDDDDEDFGIIGTDRRKSNNTVEIEESWAYGSTSTLEMSNLGNTQEDLSLNEMNG